MKKGQTQKQEEDAEAEEKISSRAGIHPEFSVDGLDELIMQMHSTYFYQMSNHPVAGSGAPKPKTQEEKKEYEKAMKEILVSSMFPWVDTQQRDQILESGLLYFRPNLFDQDDEKVSISEEELQAAKKEGKGSQAAYDARLDYKDAKAEWKSDHHYCGNCHKLLDYKKLKSCGRCLVTHYCCRDCQLADWSSHKKQCKHLKNERIRKSVVDPLPQHYKIPTFGIVLGSSLTGYDKGVLVLVPAWEFSRWSVLKEFNEMEETKKARLSSSVCNAIRYFFKEERLSSAKITQKKVFNLAADAHYALWLGCPDVTMCDGSDTKEYALYFKSYSPVPKGWTMDKAEMRIVSPHIVKQWEAGIESCRKVFGECDADELYEVRTRFGQQK